MLLSKPKNTYLIVLGHIGFQCLANDAEISTEKEKRMLNGLILILT